MNKEVMPSLADMLAGNASRYSLVIAVAKRAREIVSDHELRGENLVENAVVLAVRDFERGFCDIEYPKEVIN